MHSIKFEPTVIKDTKTHSHGNAYERIVVLHENDIKDGLKVLRGWSVDLILIPRTFDIKHNDNKEVEQLLKLLPADCWYYAMVEKQTM